jgi:23S rRNA (adenine2503-C2)-methyltransferase
MKTDIKEMTKSELIEWLADQNIEGFRALQILKWLYMRQTDTFEEMTDLSKDLRRLLSHRFTISRLEITQVEISRDGTKKYLFRLEDGNFIESVLIPEKDHYTLCISSQAGCAQGCLFCRTAKIGFKRNLSMGEIVAQIRDVCHDLDGPKRLTNLVFMGMGEPLANYSNLTRALEIITDNDIGLKFAHRRVTVSTAGLLPNLLNLGKDTRVNLAISLNATDNDTRNRLMPVNRTYPLEKLIEACRMYPVQPGRRITFEYILLKGINDSPENAKRLVRLLRPVKAKINLIPFNEFEGSGFLRPDETDILKFQQVLLDHHYTVIIRRSKGEDISAACGQLSGKMQPI